MLNVMKIGHCLMAALLIIGCDSGDSSKPKAPAEEKISEPAASKSITIHEAAQAGDAEAVERLLKEDPSLLRAEDKRKMLPLQMAAHSGQKEVVQLLLKRGADANALGSGGRTALHWAVGMNKLDLVRLLLEAGANVNAKAPALADMTPLHVAASMGHPEQVELLLKHKADKGEKSSDGKTALQCAQEQGHKHLIDMLK